MGQAFAGQHHVLRLQPGGQPCGAENHAVNDPGLGHPSSNTDVAGRHRSADQSALYGAGSNITGDTRPRRCTLCSDTSTRRFWPGRGGSSSALLLTRSARVAFSKASQRTTQNSSCTGGSGGPARLPDGRRVRRESHARVCESCALSAHGIQLPVMATAARPNQQPCTESCVVSGNGHCEA